MTKPLLTPSAAKWVAAGLVFPGRLGASAMPSYSETLRASGLVAMHRRDVDLLEAHLLITTAWSRQVDTGDLSRQSAEKYVDVATKFVGIAQIRGASTIEQAAGHATAFVTAVSGLTRAGTPQATPVAVQHLRRSVLSRWFRTARRLGLTDLDPTRDLQLPPRAGRATRPLAEDELDTLRDFANDGGEGTREPCALALALAGAGTGEAGLIAVGDVTLERDCSTGTVRIRASGKHSERLAVLDAWGAREVAQRIEQLRTTEGIRSDWDAVPLVYSGDSDPTRVQASVSVALRNIIRRAGLGGDPGVKPASITTGAARVILDRDGITAAARFLGMRSLDAAAAAVGYDWTSDPPSQAAP